MKARGDDGILGILNFVDIWKKAVVLIQPKLEKTFFFINFRAINLHCSFIRPMEEDIKKIRRYGLIKEFFF